MRSIAEEQAEYDVKREDDPFFKIIGIADGYDDITDGSVNHDHYLYGWRKVRE